MKPRTHAKTRLTLPPPQRAAAAEAMLTDVLAAAAAVAEVALVSSDPSWRRLGVPLLPDPGGGLTAALTRPYGRRPLAILVGDLPALRPAELAAALDAADTGPGAAVVADAAGAGTTLLAAADPADLRPRFGPGSRRRHVAAGARDLTAALAAPGLRHDVDTVADLATDLPLGAATRAWAATLASGAAPAADRAPSKSAGSDSP